MANRPVLLTQLEFAEQDFDAAQELARRLNYEQTVYTSTSALIGLFCLPENPARNPQRRPTVGGCIIKTRELGMMFVQDLEDLHAEDVGRCSKTRDGKHVKIVPPGSADAACGACGMEL